MITETPSASMTGADERSSRTMRPARQAPKQEDPLPAGQAERAVKLARHLGQDVADEEDARREPVASPETD